MKPKPIKPYDKDKWLDGETPPFFLIFYSRNN